MPTVITNSASLIIGLLQRSDALTYLRGRMSEIEASYLSTPVEPASRR